MRTSYAWVLGIALVACKFDSSGQVDGGVGGSSSGAVSGASTGPATTVAASDDTAGSASGASTAPATASSGASSSAETTADSSGPATTGSTGTDETSSSGGVLGCAGVLWIGNAPSPAGTTDQPLYDALSDAGQEITYVVDDQVTAADAAGYCVVLISAVADSADLLDEFELVDVPVVIWESSLFDDMGFGSSGIDEGAIDVEIVAPEHELAAGLDGIAQLYSGVGRVNWANAASATVIAQRPGEPYKAGLFAYEAGDLLEDGTVVPARRVGLPFCNAGDGTLQPDAIAIFLAAVTWAMA